MTPWNKGKKTGIIPWNKGLSKPPREYSCLRCGKTILVKWKRAKRKFCSASCSNLFYAHTPERMKQAIKNLGKPKYGKEHHLWKGGFITSYGYKMINIKGKKIFEHRYLVEQKLGRKLLRSECVHHLNGNKTDNRLENLVVMTLSGHMSFHTTSRPHFRSVETDTCLTCGIREYYSKGFCKKCYRKQLYYKNIALNRQKACEHYRQKKQKLLY